MCEHKWVSRSDLEKPGYLSCEGDHGPIDTTPIATVVILPQKGDLCFSCGRVYGLQNQIDPTFQKVLKKRESLSW